MSYATLLSAIKYARASGETKGEGILKKAGYFQSEKPLVEKIYNEISRDRTTRFPLTYIMEAADDISYCLSDISDGIEKRIITIDDFKHEFKRVWKEKYGETSCPVELPDSQISFNLSFAVPWSKLSVDEAANNFIDNYDIFFEGRAKQLIPENGMDKVLETIKQVSRNTLYASIEAESIELTGYAVITGILEYYQRLLELPYEKFELLLKGEARNLDYERRLFNRVGKRYLKAYNYMLDENRGDSDFKLKEWWARVHLVVDHISGMTDEFALNTYQMLKGINLLPL